MPGIYKVFTAVVAVIGNASLVSTGELNPVFSLAGSGLLWGYYRSLRGFPVLPKRTVGRLSLATFLVFIVDFVTSADIFIAVAQMSLVFQTIKSFDIKDSWDPPQVFFMSLLQLLIASELTSSISFGIVFVLFIVFLVVAILLGHFVKEGQKVFRPYIGIIVLATLVSVFLTSAIFVAMPRLRSGLWGKSFTRGIRTTGFTEKVDFGSYENIKEDETVIIRMIISPDPGGPHYLRGMTFSDFDGFSWQDTLKDSRKLYRSLTDFRMDVPEGATTFESEILLEPIASDVVFTFKKPYGFESQGFWVRRDSAGSFYMRQKSSKRFNYKLLSYEGDYADNTNLRRYIQIPGEMSSLQTLTEGVVRDQKTDEEKARAILDYLLGNYSYSLHAEKPPPGTNVIEYFLFGSKKGYCEHFATAMAMMLRSVGIPSRLVTGFMSGEKNDFGDYYLIRQSNAHSWVEAYIGGKWEPFDPTPPVESGTNRGLSLLLDLLKMQWERYVVGFSNYDQLRMLNYIKGISLPDVTTTIPLPAGLGVCAVFFLGWIIYRVRVWRLPIRPAHKMVSLEYVRFRKNMIRHGGQVGPASTSADVLREAIRIGKFGREDIAHFIDLYRIIRFSGREETALIRDFAKLSKKLKR